MSKQIATNLFWFVLGGIIATCIIAPAAINMDEQNAELQIQVDLAQMKADSAIFEAELKDIILDSLQTQLPKDTLAIQQITKHYEQEIAALSDSLPIDSVRKLMRSRH